MDKKDNKNEQERREGEALAKVYWILIERAQKRRERQRKDEEE